MKINLSLIFSLLTSLSLLGTNEMVNISGKVYSYETGDPIINAQVSEDGFLIAITNNEGEFQFKSAKEEVIIEFSHIGYETFITSLSPSSSGFLEIAMRKIHKIDEATVVAESNSFIGSEPRAVEGFTVFAGRIADLISIDNQLTNSAVNNPRQTFSRVSGLNIWETDAGGMQLSIGSRGLDPNRTAHYNVRQNGADISAEPLGYPEAYYTPNLNSVERIEIIRGAASLQYGPQFGGMMNFKMKEGTSAKKINTTATLSSGSFGLLTGYLSFDGQIDNVNYFISGSKKQGDGWTPNSFFDQTSFYGGIKLKTSKRSSIKFSLSYMDYLAQQSGGLTDAQFQEDPYQSFRERNWFDVNWLTSSLEWNYRISPNADIESKLFLVNAQRTSIGFMEAPNRIDPGGQRDIIHGEYDNWGNETKLKLFHSIADHHATLISGARLFIGETISQQLKGNDLNETISSNDLKTITPLSDYTFTNFNHAFFIEEVLFLNKWKISPGIRFEGIHTGFIGHYTETQTDGAGNVLPGYPIKQFSDGESNRSVFLYGLGIERKLSTSSSVLFNITKNYRPVNFSDLFISRPRQAVDPNISDEQGFSTDLEFSFHVKKWLRLSTDFYTLWYKDKIGTILTTFQDPVLGTRLLRLRTNINDGFSIGVDTNFELDMKEALKLNNEYWNFLPFGSISLNRSNYSGAETVYAEVTDGNQIEKAPNLQYKFGTRVSRGNLSLEALYSYVGEQFSDASNSTFDATGITGTVPSYSLLDLSAQYKTERLTMSINLNNALNTAYFARRAASYPGPGIISGAPRTLGVSLEIKI